MPPDTVQIGPLLISKSVFDQTLPLLTLLIGSVLGFWGKTISEKRQWKREDEKAAREEARRERERQAEAHAKLKEKLQDLYAEGVRCLAAVLHEFVGNNTARQSEAIQAAQRALSMIAVYHYDREGREFKQFYEQYSDMMINGLDKDAVYDLRQKIIDFSLQDPRLKEYFAFSVGGVT